jgi:hypothetical protein
MSVTPILLQRKVFWSTENEELPVPWPSLQTSVVVSA